MWFISREVTFLCRPLFFRQNLTTHKHQFSRKNGVCSCSFDVLFQQCALEKEGEKAAFRLGLKIHRRKKALYQRYKAFLYPRWETTTTMRDNSQQQRNRRQNEQLWRIFAILYLFVPCGCCTTSAVLSALFLFVFFSPSSSFLHLCLVLLALVAPPIVLKTDFFSGKRIWRRKAERRGS